ncbi:MAG: hypothetical protein HY340_03640 [Candidatus Kerfeldbacteria bacterium]|nr:hypothetical protein [Candidatus Kerfeldbacteria bacterium]
MEFSLIWLLIPYLALVLLVLIVASVNLYHVARFGVFDMRNRVVVTVYAVLTLLVLAGAASYLVGMDWSQTLGAELPDFQTPNLPLP